MIIDCHNHCGVELYRYLRGEYPYGQDLRTLFINADRTGVSHCIVFPCVSYQAMDLRKLRESVVELDGYLETVPYAMENRRFLRELFDYFPSLADRIIPFVNIDPGRCVQEQLNSLEALRQEYRIAGLKIQPFAVQSPIQELMGQGGAFLEFARKYNLPFMIHSSINVEDRFSQCSDILTVAEANRDLRFCLAHSCRFDRESLERVDQLKNTWFDCSAHGIHCQLAAANSHVVAPDGARWKSDYADPSAVLLDLAERYPEKLMWGSDSPAHSYASSFGGIHLELWSSYDKEVDYLKSLPPSLREKVAGTNTLAFLGLTGWPETRPENPQHAVDIIR